MTTHKAQKNREASPQVRGLLHLGGLFVAMFLITALMLAIPGFSEIVVIVAGGFFLSVFVWFTRRRYR